jgi:hypothetical protein
MEFLLNNNEIYITIITAPPPPPVCYLTSIHVQIVRSKQFFFSILYTKQIYSLVLSTQSCVVLLVINFDDIFKTECKA